MIEVLAGHTLRLEAYFRTGGVVMAPLAAVSMLMWVLIVDRLIFFRTLFRKNMDLATAREHIRSRRMPDPRRYRGMTPLLVARFLQRCSGDPRLDAFILDEVVLGINRSLDAHLAIIGTLAAVAPLLGLLGTVTGMIGTFDVLAVFGTGNAKGMADGISEALISTQTGLLVAIPGLYMKGFLERRARNLKQRAARAGYYLRRHL
ncbi:MAG: biopolymer transporter ExbB [Desulfacinum sp.]|nr:biopolymer transporter ExbB [Desulfacinum sp.]